jgi:AbrB family looped-hinge helix DNA binding protein
MTIELTITAKGQVTLRQAVLDHLGVKPGDRVGVALSRDGRVEIAPARAGHDLSRARGILQRPGHRQVSLQDMQEAIEAGRAR